MSMRSRSEIYRFAAMEQPVRVLAFGVNAVVTTPIIAWARRPLDFCPTRASRARAFAHPTRNRVGHISVRHMCDDGVLSKPRPSFRLLEIAGR